MEKENIRIITESLANLYKVQLEEILEKHPIEIVETFIPRVAAATERLRAQNN